MGEIRIEKKVICEKMSERVMRRVWSVMVLSFMLVNRDIIGLCGRF